MTAPDIRADWDTYPTAPLSADVLAKVAAWHLWVEEGGK